MEQTMWAAVYHGLHDLRVERRPIPQLRDPRDAIVRVTRSAICTSDLHILAGAVPRAVPGTILGHEFVGQVVRVGAAIHTLKPGDRVAANCETFCGDCFFAAGAMSTTASTADGNWAAASTAARRNMSGSPSRIPV